MALEVSTNVINERPAIETDDQGCVYIATRYLEGGSGLYKITLYKKCPNDSSFSETTIHEEVI